MDKTHSFLAAAVCLMLGSVTGFAEDSWQAKDAPGRLTAPAEWKIKEAPIRFMVELERQPTHPSAGYFFTIPDGGILPKPFPQIQAFDESGAPVKSAILWQSVSAGVGVVIARPADGRTVTVYVSGTAKMNLWSAESGLTPSALICTFPRQGSKADAIKLSQLGQVHPTVHFRNQPGSKEGATVALPGDRSGRPGSCAMYMLAYIDAKDPGDTWVSPHPFSGQMEVVIDGRTIRPAKKNEKPGGTGESINLSAGLHRLELFGYNSAGGATGPLLLTWRTPKTKPGELGGIRPSDLRYAGTTMWDARQLRNEEVVRSGAAAIRNAQRQDGGPVAMASLWPENIYVFPGEAPGQIQYRFRALTDANPKGTKYSWSFSSEPGAVAVGRDVPWLVRVSKDNEVTLTAEADGKQSQSSILFYPFTDRGSSMNNPSTRLAYREACLAMLKAYPTNTDVVAKWDEPSWNNFFRSLELAPEDPLVEHIVTARWESFSKALPLERRELIEELFLQENQSRDPKLAFKTAAMFAETTKSRPRKLMMQLKQAEILMYYLNDLPLAEKLLIELVSESGEVGQWAQIRMGDIEFLKRNLNEATQRYGEVQNRSTHGKAAEPTGIRRLTGPTLGGPVKAADFAKKKQGELAPKKKSAELDSGPAVASWKLAAIRDVAASEEVASLMAQGFHMEAWQAMKRWEREFPLSKLTSDYILQEGSFLIWQGDFVRAKAVLSAYCEQIDASNFVPKALKLVVRCMIELRESEADITKYEKEIAKRLEFRSGEE